MPHPFVASGNIKPNRFVKLSGDNKVAQASTNEAIIGVSQVGSNRAPLDDLVSTVYAATSGQGLHVFQEGEVCPVQVGSGQTITAGLRLKSDSDGCAVPLATTGTTVQECGGIARTGGTAGELIMVEVNLQRHLPAIS